MTMNIGAEEPSTNERRPHAILDRDTRIQKARKILAIIGAERFRDATRILEIGCGSGVIASTLAMLGEGRIEVHAVDVVDNRIERDGYTFRLVEGTALPFDDAQFDIVISNHVIEHVGDESDQRCHLREIGRTLAHGGIVYLAVPNRWRLVEPHYRLPLLSWLPHPASDRYLRLARRGTHYDCEPLAHMQATALFESAGFAVLDQTIRALRETLAIEFAAPISRLFNRLVPDWVPRMFMAIMPTYVFLLRRKST